MKAKRNQNVETLSVQKKSAISTAKIIKTQFGDDFYRVDEPQIGGIWKTSFSDSCALHASQQFQLFGSILHRLSEIEFRLSCIAKESVAAGAEFVKLTYPTGIYRMLYDVPAMPITSRYILLCDEVRREDNGKLIVLGLYTVDVGVPQIPFTLPSLTFFAVLDADVGGNFQFTLRLEHLETAIQTGRPVAEAMGAIRLANPGTAVVPVRFGNVQLIAPGPYVFSLNIPGQDPISLQFQVRLNTRRVQGQPHGQQG